MKNKKLLDIDIVKSIKLINDYGDNSIYNNFIYISSPPPEDKLHNANYEIS